MTSSRAFGRTVAGGLAAVLTTGGLVIAAAPIATAAEGSTIYTCAMPVLGSVAVPVDTSIPDFPSELPAGAPVGTYDADFVLGVSDQLATLLGSVTGESVAGFHMPLGATAVPVGGFSLGALTGPLGSQTMSGSSSTGAFALPEPGAYELSMPTSFTFLGSSALGDVEVPCVTDAPAVLGTMTVLPTGDPGEDPVAIPSTTEASVVKKRIVKGKRAKISVVSLAGVDPLIQAAQGLVVVRKGKRAVGRGELDETGAAVIRTKRFKRPGRYTLTVKYLGDELTEASKDKVRVRVVRRR